MDDPQVNRRGPMGFQGEGITFYRQDFFRTKLNERNSSDEVVSVVVVDNNA